MNTLNHLRAHLSAHLRRLVTAGALSAAMGSLAVGSLAAGCSPGSFDTSMDMDFGSCSAPTAEGADPDKLRGHNKVTLPWVPRQLTQNVAEPWSSGRALAVHGDEVFVTDRDNGALVVLDASQQLAVKRTIAVGARPEQVVVGPNGDAWVSVRHSGNVAFIKAGESAVTATIAVGVEPIGLAMSPKADQVFVAVAGDKNLVVIDVADQTIVQTLPTLQVRPRAVTAVISPNTGELMVMVIDQSGAATRMTRNSAGTLTRSSTSSPRNVNPSHRLGFSKKNLKAWRATGGAVHPESGQTLVSHVLVSPGDAAALLQSAKVGAAGDTNLKKASSGGYGASGDACDPGAPIRPIEVSLSQLGDAKPAAGKQFTVADAQTGRAFLTRFDQPSDVNHHPSVSLAFMTNYGTDNVLVLNTGRLDVMEFPIAELKVGHAPKAIAFSTDGKRAFVLNQHGFSVSEVDLSPLLDLTVAAYKPSDAMPPQTAPMTLTPVRTVVFAKDPNSQVLQEGRRLFTFTGSAKISQSQRFACASCHLEGTDDKMVWFIADGPRQTPSLAGRLQGTAPFNWTGSEPELQGNMDRTIKRMGGKGLAKAELAALEQFMLHGLVAPPNPHFDGQLTEAQARGKLLFNDKEVGCAGCHTGGTGTDGVNWDVGTVTAEEKLMEQFRAVAAKQKPREITFNTPSLRGLYYTGPFLHDGSAKTLLDVLNRTAKTMGKTSHLSSAQKNDLVAYLMTL